jgi:hypothetical protein
LKLIFPVLLFFQLSLVLTQDGIGEFGPKFWGVVAPGYLLEPLFSYFSELIFTGSYLVFYPSSVLLKLSMV